MKATGEEAWQAYRRAMLKETEQFIEWGLRHPELVNWIPAKPVGAGGFPRQVCEWFYRTVFSGSGESEGWRQRLRRAVSRR